MCIRDRFLTLGYKSEASLRHLYHSAQKHEAFEDHVIEVVLGGYSGKPCRLFDEAAVMFICQQRAGREGAVELMRWIEAGGMDIDQLPPAPKVETLPVEEVELLPPPRHMPSPVSYTHLDVYKRQFLLQDGSVWATHSTNSSAVFMRSTLSPGTA